jgi:beta-phosphoglucomutase-like phosphatase (HAD superfamily)
MTLRVVGTEAPYRGQHATLRAVLRRCRPHATQSTPVVVFDLDGTLMDNRPRTLAILHEYADRCTVRDPELAERLVSARLGDLAYLLTDSLERLGAHRTDLVADMQAFWRDRFFADAHLVHDTALPGAVDFARACYDAGASLVYLTGRDLPLMGMGTFASLRDLGFPIGVPATELVLKPDAAMPDEAFKRDLAPELARIGHVVAAFDNEPANCNVMAAHYPDAHIVFVDTQHAPGAPPLAASICTVRDFRVD